MNLFPEMAISGSGLNVERSRLEVIAKNIANINTTKTETGEAFRRQLVQVMEDQDENGVQGGALVTGITQDPSPFHMVFEPGHPDANAEGYVAKPNVDVMMEMVDMMGASRGYEANVTVLQSSKEMARAAMDL